MAQETAPDPLGPRIRWLRQRRGLSQAELARDANISQPTLSAYEHQTQAIPYTVVKRIALALNTTVGWLAGDAPDPGHQLFPGASLTRRGIRLVLQVHSIEEEIDADLVFAKLEVLLKSELERIAVRERVDAEARHDLEQRRLKARRGKLPPGRLMEG